MYSLPPSVREYWKLVDPVSMDPASIKEPILNAMIASVLFRVSILNLVFKYTLDVARQEISGSASRPALLIKERRQEEGQEAGAVETKVRNRSLHRKV